ncbi:Uncharacterised protein [Klebsiella pneumoniae]|nr:Uncharacterised protein [Klebsiella pneumoniae]
MLTCSYRCRDRLLTFFFRCGRFRGCFRRKFFCSRLGLLFFLSYLLRSSCFFRFRWANSNKISGCMFVVACSGGTTLPIPYLPVMQGSVWRTEIFVR